jgi:ABC-type polysaccharide/polyol phosphate transport system ATPase subunit
MSSEPIISLRNVNKIYQAYDHPIHRLLARLGCGQTGRHKEFHALNNVSFDIRKGETVGIIGRNGSGKSTLLQIICGIRKPTSGSVSINGRISALLELGSGFQPEFTGRENVFLQGAVMGFSREEMEMRFDEIAAFADIGEYIDQPVKTYSSGMFVRLAFAIAVNVDPDILVIDEALAVGDMAFQRRCFARLRQLMSDKSRIVILVSHDLRQVERFCARVLYLQHGHLIADGASFDACKLYHDQMNQVMKNDAATHASAQAQITSSGEAELLEISINNFDPRVTPELYPCTPLRVTVRIKLLVPLAHPEFIIGTQAADFLYLSSSSTTEFESPQFLPAGEHIIEYALEQFPLASGQYFIRFGIRDEHFRLLFAGEGLCPFLVIPDPLDVVRPNRLLDLKTNWVVSGTPLQAKHLSIGQA